MGVDEDGTGTRVGEGYDGPVVDAFLHTPWLGGDYPSDPRGDVVDWHGDARLARVMHAGGWHGTPGAEKVLFASDHPLLDMGRATASARRLPLSEPQLRNVLHDNARRLFWPGEGDR